jgi:uncharacterized membrane protein YedE/YeeE
LCLRLALQSQVRDQPVPDQPLLHMCVFLTTQSIAGMTSTAKVVAFLTPASAAFDTSLAFVMASAVGVAIIPFQMVFRWKLLKTPILVGNKFVIAPTRVDHKLLTGAVLFGAGWGATGLCPGPAIANLVVPSIRSLAVVLAMLLGMQLPPWLYAI